MPIALHGSPLFPGCRLSSRLLGVPCWFAVTRPSGPQPQPLQTQRPKFQLLLTQHVFQTPTPGNQFLTVVASIGRLAAMAASGSTWAWAPEGFLRSLVLQTPRIGPCGSLYRSLATNLLPIPREKSPDDAELRHREALCGGNIWQGFRK